jgi:hypothetical protein
MGRTTDRHPPEDKTVRKVICAPAVHAGRDLSVFAPFVPGPKPLKRAIEPNRTA